MDRAIAVAVDVAATVRGQVERVVEGSLGWQVVAPDDPVLPPRCLLVDVVTAPAHADRPTPLVLLVGSDDDPVRVARAARHASGVVDGVPDATTLAALVEELSAAPPDRAPWCTVAAAAGGVGATTVATALGGLRAWRHGPTLVAVTGPTHQPSAPRVAPGDLASPAAWAAAAPAVGVDDCRVVGLRDVPQAAVAVADAGPVPLVLEHGVGVGRPDVVVVRPDRAGLAAAEASRGTVVLVGQGPVGARRIRAATEAGVVELAWSARVGAAGAAGRLPTDVPGRWLQPLVAVVDALVARDRRP